MTNDTRTPEEIEREIERERAGLTNTLGDLQDKFSVETIARQFTDQFRAHGGDIGRSVSDAVKANPVALALTGVGLAWLMMGDRSGGRDRYDRSRSYGRTSYDDRRDPDDHYGHDNRDYDRVGQTGLPSRAAGSLQPKGRTLGPQPGDPSKPYYSGRYSDDDNTPSWARTGDDDDGRGLGAKAGDAASSVADKARSAESAATDKLKGAATAATDAGNSVAEGARNMASTASEKAAALRDRLAQGTDSLSDEARDRVIAARESALHARDSAARYARQGRDRAVDIFEEQPLIAGALALAVGAAIGAALPRSRMEDEYLGEQSDHLMDEAERIFEEEKQKIGKVAKAATDEAKKIVGEAKDNADEAAPGDTAADAVANKAKASGKRIADAAKAEAEKQKLGDMKKS